MLDGSNPDPKFFSKTSFIQMGYGLWVSSVNILIGLALGFPSSAIPQLKDDAKFSIGPSDEAWIASVLTLVAPVGCIIGGYIMDIFGRRYALVLGGIPFLVGWISIGLSKSATHIIIGRIFTGVGCGMGMGTPRVYVTEISLPNMRGVIAVFTTLSLSFGLTLQALLGSSFKWNELCLSYGVFSAVISISSLLLPETPYYVLIKSTQNEAEKVLKRFRGAEYDTRNEITEMMDFKATNNISGLTFGTQIKLFVTRAVCLPFWIVIGYSVVTQLSGTSIIFVWTVDFLQASKVSLDSGSAHFFMELVRLGMGVVSAILMYKIGRRTQALISSFGVAVMCFVLGFLLLYNHSVTIYPFICYLLYVTFSTLGYYTLPFVMMYELYPLQVRGVLGGLTNSIINFMVFGVNAAFPFFRDLVGHAYILISFAMASILGTVFLFFCLPETKDLTLQEIEEYFNDLRPTLVSQRSVIAAQRSQLLTQTLESNALRSRSTLDLTLSKAAGRKPLN